MDEIAEMTPRYAGISHERVGRGGLQWPVAPDGTDTPILYDGALRARGRPGPLRRRCPYKPPGDQADEEFPLILVTGRRLEHYNAGTMTRRTGNLELMSEDWLEVHPDDAAALGLEDGETVTVRSRRGRDRAARAGAPSGSSRATCSRPSTSRRCAPTC